MVEVVDSIVAELIAKADSYVTNFDKATAAHERFYKSTNKLAGQTFDLNAESQKYKAGANAIGQAEEQLTAKVTRSRKARADASAASDEREVSSAKRSAKAKADAVIAEAEREASATARLAAVADRAADRAANRTSGTRHGHSSIGAMTTPEPSGQASIPLALLNGTAPAEVAAEKQVNALKVEQIGYEDALKYLTGQRRQAVIDIRDEILLSNRLEAQGVAESEIALRLEQRRAAVAAERALANKAGRNGATGIEQFARGAGAGPATGGAAAIAGIAVAAAVGVTIEAVKSATEYARALKSQADALGLSTDALQVYQAAARNLNVTEEQLQSGLGQFAANLGKAREGSQEQAKTFAALGVDIKTAASAGDLLPTLIDRISSIKDPAQRAAIETRLFGEEGRRLDGLLSGGTDQVNNLAEALQRTGAILSSSDISHLDDVSKKLEQVKAKLEVSIAETVARNSDAILKLADSFSTLVDRIGAAINAMSAFANSGVGQFLGNYLDKASRVAALANPVTAPFAAYSEAQRAGYLPSGSGKPPPGAVAGTAAGALLGGQVQPGKVDFKVLGSIGASAGRGGSRGSGTGGPSAETMEKRAAAREKNYFDQLGRLQDAELNARSEQTQDELDRAAIKQELLKHDHDRQVTDIDLQVREKRLTAARADQLKEQLQVTYTEQQSANALEGTLETIKRNYDITIGIIDAKEQQLRDQESIAQTVAERRDIELKLLDLEKQRETATASQTISRAQEGDPSVSTSDLNAANRTLRTQGRRQASSRAVIEAQNRGPGAEYLASLPTTVDKLNEAFENAEVNGLRKFNDGLAESVAGFLHLHGIAGDFLTDLIKIGLQRELTAPIASTLFGGTAGAGGSGGGFLGGLSKIFGSILGGGSGSGIIPGSLAESSAFSFTDPSALLAGIPGFATGGGGIIGGNGGVDRNVLSLNGKPVAKVGRGEMLSITPANMGAVNQRVSAAPPQVTVIAPQHFDLSNAVMTSDLVAQIDVRNRAYADAVGRASYGASVQTAAGQVPGVISRQQTLKS